MKIKTEPWVGSYIVLAILAFSAYGWIANLVKIANLEAFNGVAIVRILGVLFAPLGAIMGWL